MGRGWCVVGVGQSINGRRKREKRKETTPRDGNGCIQSPCARRARQGRRRGEGFQRARARKGWVGEGEGLLRGEGGGWPEWRAAGVVFASFGGGSRAAGRMRATAGGQDRSRGARRECGEEGWERQGKDGQGRRREGGLSALSAPPFAAGRRPQTPPDSEPAPRAASPDDDSSRARSRPSAPTKQQPPPALDVDADSPSNADGTRALFPDPCAQSRASPRSASSKLLALTQALPRRSRRSRREEGERAKCPFWPPEGSRGRSRRRRRRGPRGGASPRARGRFKRAGGRPALASHLDPYPRPSPVQPPTRSPTRRPQTSL